MRPLSGADPNWGGESKEGGRDPKMGELKGGGQRPQKGRESKGGAETPKGDTDPKLGVSEPPPGPQHPQQWQQPRVRCRLLNELLHLRENVN